MLNRIRNQRGMSLIEIMIVLGIIAAASAAIVASVTSGSTRARTKQTQAQISDLTLKIKEYKVDKQKYPTSWDDMVSAKLIEEAPVDPWGNELHLEVPGPGGGKFSVWSDGEDTETEEDDITSWKAKDED